MDVLAFLIMVLLLVGNRPLSCCCPRHTEEYTRGSRLFSVAPRTPGHPKSGGEATRCHIQAGATLLYRQLAISASQARERTRSRLALQILGRYRARTKKELPAIPRHSPFSAKNTAP